MTFRRSLILASVALGLGSPNAWAGGPQSADKDSCYVTVGDCVSVREKWMSDGEFRLQITNNCGGRIYYKYCFEKKNRNYPSCGASGLRRGESSWPAVTSTYNGTGRWRIEWVGSLRQSSDWVCAGKVPDWGDYAETFN